MEKLSDFRYPFDFDYDNFFAKEGLAKDESIIGEYGIFDKLIVGKINLSNAKDRIKFKEYYLLFSYRENEYLPPQYQPYDKIKSDDGTLFATVKIRSFNKGVIIPVGKKEENKEGPDIRLLGSIGSYAPRLVTINDGNLINLFVDEKGSREVIVDLDELIQKIYEACYHTEKEAGKGFGK